VTGSIAATDVGLVAAIVGVGAIDRSRCRKEADIRFSTARMVADHLDVYQRAIERRRSR
jgi:hypothetical protein